MYYQCALQGTVLSRYCTIKVLYYQGALQGTVLTKQVGMYIFLVGKYTSITQSLAYVRTLSQLVMIRTW